MLNNIARQADFKVNTENKHAKPQDICEKHDVNIKLQKLLKCSEQRLQQQAASTIVKCIQGFGKKNEGRFAV
jgi:hypothetical protein